jgi:hypothetical protein
MKAEADRERKNKKLEDDFPSAPPPPLSSFVDRGPFELLQPTHRHASTPSVPSITSPKLGLSSPGIATYGPLQCLAISDLIKTAWP